jgi:OOP family OmpA-OmpF porin
MLLKKCITDALFFAVFLMSGALLAADNGVYIGGSIGQTRVHFDGTPAIASGLPVTYDNSDSAWTAFGGYQFNKYFSAELTYVKLGNYHANLAVPGVGNLFTNIQITGWGPSIVGTLPLRNDLAILGRIGETYMRETRGNCDICIGTVSTASDNTWSPTVGIGLKYDFNSSLSARGELTHYTNIGKSTANTFGANMNLYTVGFAYKFF